MGGGTAFGRNSLRVAESLLTAREITNRILAENGIKSARLAAVRDLTGSVNASLRNRNGDSVMAVGEGMPARRVIA